MKRYSKKGFMQKIIIAMIIVVLVNFIVPIGSYAKDDAQGWPGDLLREAMQLFAAVGDAAMGLMNHVMLGTDEYYSSVMLSNQDINVSSPESAIYADSKESVRWKEFDSEEFNGLGIDSGDGWKIPNMLYCPENIFANNIPALDINFINPTSYTGVDGEAKDSISDTLKPIISSWYKGFRDIAAVGLLCVLVYVGIRIVLGTSIQEQVKYKEMLKDWLVALCLVFIIHFIMSGILMITQKVTDLLSNSTNDYIYIKVGDVHFKTNLMGYIRLMAESTEWSKATSYTILYFVLIIYTGMFTFMYLKRVLYMAFFTMIAPLVALTYPIDKMGDSKAQAFNMWFKEYLMNAIIQPVHLLLYTVFVSSAIDLASDNPIYAMVALYFLIPAEKFIKKMFGLNKAESEGGFGSFAGGALTMSLLQGMAKKPPLHPKGEDKKSSGSSRDDDDTIGTKPIKTADRARLSNFGGNNSDNGNSGDKDNEERNTRKQTGTLPPSNEHQVEGEQQNPKLDNGQTVNDEKIQDRNSGDDRDYYDNNSSDSNDVNMKQEFDNGKENLGNDNDSSKEQLDDGKDNVNSDNFSFKGQQDDRLKLPRQKSTANNVGSSAKKMVKNGKKVVKGVKRQAKAIGGTALGRTVIRGVKAKDKNGKYILAKGFGGLAKGVAKIGLRGVGTLGGATIGLAAGIASGDLGNAVKYTMAGATAGNMIGKNVYDTGAAIGNTAVNAGKKVVKGTGNIMQAYKEESKGFNEAHQERLEKQNKKAYKNFMSSNEEQKKYREMAYDINKSTGKNYSVRDVMNAAWDYQMANITDESKIKKGLKMEAKRDSLGSGETHQQIMDIIDLTSDYGKDYITDEKKRQSMEENIKSTVGENNKDKVMDLFAEANGESDYWNDIKRKREQEKLDAPRIAKEKAEKEAQEKLEAKKAREQEIREEERIRYQERQRLEQEKRDQQNNDEIRKRILRK